MSQLVDQLTEYKRLIDADIGVYATHVRSTTASQYGTYPTMVTNTFLDMLERGGKRLRGALVIAGYQMCGGNDMTMIIRAATAIEMIHAHLLIIDDIQDNSKVRRGRPTVHEILKTYHEAQGFSGDSRHTGMSLGINAALTGGYAAQMLIGGLNVEPQLRSNAMGIIAHAVLTTAHGQTLDFIQELKGQATEADIEHTMEWKTAYYSILNPLCVGMVLAGAGCADTDAIREYALHAGKAFQITDDILGVFGTDTVTGKNSLDDMREGKQTILTVYVNKQAGASQRAYFQKCLGKPNLTQTELLRCQDILKGSGALAYAEKLAANHAAAAVRALEHAPHRWHREQVRFMQELVQSFAERTV